MALWKRAMWHLWQCLENLLNTKMDATYWWWHCSSDSIVNLCHLLCAALHTACTMLTTHWSALQTSITSSVCKAMCRQASITFMHQWMQLAVVILLASLSKLHHTLLELLLPRQLHQAMSIFRGFYLNPKPYLQGEFVACSTGICCIGSCKP